MGQHTRFPLQNMDQHTRFPLQNMDQHNGFPLQNMDQHNRFPLQNMGQHTGFPLQNMGQHNGFPLQNTWRENIHFDYLKKLDFFVHCKSWNREKDANFKSFILQLLLFSKELSLCQNLWFSNPYIFAIQCGRHYILQNIKYVRSNNLSLKC